MVTESSLLIDVGNTNIKCALSSDIDQVTIIEHLRELSAYIKANRVRAIWMASVNGSEHIDYLTGFCDEQSITLNLVSTEKERFGLINSYENVSTMGVDRWLAMVGAHELTTKPFLVIDIGTALTCDFVADGQHLGGWIVPGFHLMRQSLVENTKKVFVDDQHPQSLSLGNRTEDCVAMGCLSALQGVLRSAIDYYSSTQTEFDVFITGGDKKMLTGLNLGDSLSSANLVMRGLARYANNVTLL